jgi:endonuclease/exonuclease/phosphatase family metal-dependent hydrolase
LKLNSDIPWLVVGDFNEAMWQEEYMSKTPRAAAQMKDFRDALADCDLHDLGFTGVPFTYDNKRSGNANVKVRLDRAVANPAWRDRFVNARLNHHVSPCSDHCPISLNIVQENNL